MQPVKLFYINEFPDFIPAYEFENIDVQLYVMKNNTGTT